MYPGFVPGSHSRLWGREGGPRQSRVVLLSGKSRLEFGEVEAVEVGVEF